MIGFDFQVNNDEDGQGTRDSVAIWSDPTGQSYQNTTRFGVLEFTKSSAPGGGDGDGGEHSGGGNGGNGGSGGTAGGGGSSPSPSTSSLEIRNHDGRIIVGVSSRVLQQAMEKAVAGTTGTKRALVNVPAQKGAQSYDILPGKCAGESAGSSPSPNGVRYAGNAKRVDSGDRCNGYGNRNARLEKSSGGNLDAALREKIGDRPVFRAEVLAGERALSWKQGKHRLIWSMPYSPPRKSLHDRIISWFGISTLTGAGSAFHQPV